MLTYAIGFVQDVQLVCFAIVLGCMALQNKANLSLRWLAFGYLSGLVGSLLTFGGHWLPPWLSLGLALEAAPVGYACFHRSVIYLVDRGAWTRWISVALLGATLPVFFRWSAPGHMSQSATLADAILAAQTALTVVLLLAVSDAETRAPRRVMGAFLAAYSAVECLRVSVYFATGHMPAHVSPALEAASGIVYVVSCSVLPLAFLWMMNVRLVSHLNRQALMDPLTEVLNRRGLQSAGENELARHRRSGQDFAVVLLDLDYFKRLNDTLGHAGGDAALRATAAFLKDSVRKSDVVGRLGGEEFVVVLPGTQSGEAEALIERLRLALQQHSFATEGGQVKLTASFGITVSGGRADLRWEGLLHEADLALYAAKRAGRNLARLYNPAATDLPDAHLDVHAESFALRTES